MSIEEEKNNLAPVITVHETDGAEFQKACAKAVANGYVLSSSHCGFVDSADYDYCSSWMAIFVRTESKPESKLKPGPRPEAKPADDAPEGATHYKIVDNYPEFYRYERCESRYIYAWLNEDWMPLDAPFIDVDLLLKELTPIT